MFYFAIPSETFAQKFNGNIELLDSNKMPKGCDLTYKNQHTYRVQPDSLIKKQGSYSLSIESGDATGNSGALSDGFDECFVGRIICIIFLKEVIPALYPISTFELLP